MMKNKRKKNPNGFGTICQHKRRAKTDRQYTVYANSITIFDSKTGKKRIYRKTLGHFRTYNEAYSFLIKYNNDPEEMRKNITFNGIYTELKKEWFPKLSDNSKAQYIYVYRKLKAIYDLPIKEIKTKQLQEIINPYLNNNGIKRALKVIFNKVFEYADKYDYINKNYSKFINLGRNTEKQVKIIYSKEETEKLWELKDNYCVKIVLIMLYTGMRLGEIRTLLKKNVYLNESYMVGGIKTEAGRNRIIPICDKIKPIVSELLNDTDNKKETLINTSLEANQFNIWLRRHLRYLGFDHKSHDCRHTFASNMRDLEVPYEITETIMGHKCKSLLLNTYTHIRKEKLIEAVNMLG
ncbi:MAG: tyrosine-type recombinase/integrase [Armatimonadetes bacterium]|nr:tyrosine-type recombinase/integrase [Candidatus Hippobium faecium]